MKSSHYCSEFKTIFGIGAVLGNEDQIFKVLLPGSQIPNPTKNKSKLTKRVATMLQHYFAGEEQDFSKLKLDLSSLTPFQQRILTLARHISFGEVINYGELAKRAGNPKCARGVGKALGANPIPIIIPCHRIIASNGALTGYTAPGGIEMKSWLLQNEGSIVTWGKTTMKSATFKQGEISKKIIQNLFFS